MKNSLIDYPGKVSCVIFLSGCNFNCPYCHNPSLIKNSGEYPDLLEDGRLFEFLKERTDFIDGVVISGGEPTLQNRLFKLCERIKRLGYSIKLDTNGSRPERLRKLLEAGLVDYVAMDIKTDPTHYDPLIQKGCNPEDILSSLRIIMDSAPDYEFRTTCVKGFVDESIMERIGNLIEGARLYALQQFNNSEVLHPEFFRSNDSYHNPDEIMCLKSIADPWVERCIVRNSVLSKQA